MKDGAASIYGARAGNGVILITTKRGTDQKPTITLNTAFTWQGVTKMLKPASSGQRAEMEREAWLQSGQPEAVLRLQKIRYRNIMMEQILFFRTLIGIKNLSEIGPQSNNIIYLSEVEMTDLNFMASLVI